jgi:uncharacterized protein YjbI with pentapeptide repeats
VRDVVLALAIGLLLLAGQWLIDDRRSQRETRISADLADEAERRENLRFIRDRSSVEQIERPFSGMDLDSLKLTGLNLSGANLSDASLLETSLAEVDLSGALLTGASLGSSSFFRAVLRDAVLGCSEPEPGCGATQFSTLFLSADLTRADLTGMSFFRADFTGAIMTEAVVADVRMSRTKLYGTDLTRADLRGTEFVEVCYDDTTRWPSGYSPPPSAPPKTCNR